MPTPAVDGAPRPQTAGDVEAEKQSSPTPNRRRLASLDFVRGCMLIVSVSVNSILFMPEWFNHAAWDGVHPLDLVFPAFVTLSGCGLAFAMRRTIKVKPLIRRFFVLIAVGLIYNAVTHWTFDLATWRLPGVLQLYAAIVFLIAMGHLVTKSWQGWLAITVLLSIAHSWLIASTAATCPGMSVTPTCNPSGPIDSLLFGLPHLYHQGTAGYDPEGTIAIFGALITAAAGATVGHLLLTLVHVRAEGYKVQQAVLPLVAVAGTFVGIAWALRTFIPVLTGGALPTMKKLWTAPFALEVVAFMTVALVIGHVLLDRPRIEGWLGRASYPLVSLGRNSLLVYFGSHVLQSLLVRSFAGHRSIAAHFIAVMPSHHVAQAVWTALLLGFWVVLATFLHSRRIYLRP